MLNANLKKTIALALATVTFSLPIFTNEAFAAPHENRNHQRVERRADHRVSRPNPHHGNHHRVEHNRRPVERVRHLPPRPVQHRPAPPPARRDRGYHHHHSSNGNLVGGIIIGAILGSIIANNNVDA